MTTGQETVLMIMGKRRCQSLFVLKINSDFTLFCERNAWLLYYKGLKRKSAKWSNFTFAGGKELLRGKDDTGMGCLTVEMNRRE